MAWHEEEDGMAVQRRRVGVLSGVVLAGIAILATIAPAVAQVPPGTQAITYVGGPVADCPPGSPGALVPAAATVNGVTISGAGRCTPLAADAEGTYSVGGSSPLNFTSECANVGGTVQSRSAVVVPAGTTVNGAVVAAPTTVDTPNAAVVFPGGRTATLNVVTTTPTSLTRDAIVFGQGGPVVGRVICGVAAAYPLAVDTAGASDAAAPLPVLPAADGDGPGISFAALAAGALALMVLAQLAVGRRLRRGDRTA